MDKKLISSFTVLAFAIFSLGCFTTKNRRLETVAVEKRKGLAILSVEIKTGETYEFQKEKPGRVHEDRIIGSVERVAEEEIELDRTNIKATKIDKKGNISEFATKEGEVYKVSTGSLHEEKDKFVFVAVEVLHEPISIPLSEVSQINVQEFSLSTTLLVTVGILALSYLSLLGLLFSVTN